jgi:hypothetical protein
MIHRIVMSRRVALSEHVQYAIEILTRQISIRIGATDQCEQLILAAITRGALCNDLL